MTDYTYTVDYYRDGRRIDQAIVVGLAPFDEAHEVQTHNRFFPRLAADAAKVAA